MQEGRAGERSEKKAKNNKNDKDGKKEDENNDNDIKKKILENVKSTGKKDEKQTNKQKIM